MIRSYLNWIARYIKQVPFILQYKEWLISQGVVLCICGMFGLLVTGLFVFWGGVILCGSILLFIGIIAWCLSAPNLPQGGIPLINTVATESRVYAAFSFVPVISTPFQTSKNPYRATHQTAQQC